MEMGRLSCNLCLGADLERYLEPSPCGRRLLRCRLCGVVTALHDGLAGAVEEPAPAGRPRDERTDQRRAAAIMEILPRGRVLEIGCGGGGFLARLDPSRYEVVGIERSPSLARQARARLAPFGGRGVVLETAVAETRLPSEAFDLVAMFGSLGCCRSPRRTFMEVSRALRGGGYAVVETPGLSSLTARLCGPRWEPLGDPAAEYFFTTPSLERLAVSCGLGSGAAWLTLPVGWPSPGTLVYVARKTGSPARAAALSDLAADVGSMNPVGATR